MLQSIQTVSQGFSWVEGLGKNVLPYSRLQSSRLELVRINAVAFMVALHLCSSLPTIMIQGDLFWEAVEVSLSINGRLADCLQVGL